LHDANVAEARRCKGALAAPPEPQERLRLVEADPEEMLLPTLAVLPVAMPEDGLDPNVPVSEVQHSAPRSRLARATVK
jgi:hypothetical protein